LVERVERVESMEWHGMAEGWYGWGGTDLGEFLGSVSYVAIGRRRRRRR
jgi:hypothetical protein